MTNEERLAQLEELVADLQLQVKIINEDLDIMDESIYQEFQSVYKQLERLNKAKEYIKQRKEVLGHLIEQNKRNKSAFHYYGGQINQLFILEDILNGEDHDAGRVKDEAAGTV